MKSFRFYWRDTPPETLPEKTKVDYAPDELAAFQADFRRRWDIRRRFVVPLYVTVAVACVAYPLVLIFAAKWAFISAPFWLAFAIYAALFCAFPRCPACGNEIDRFVVRYCPNCGNNSIESATFLRTARCHDCDSVLKSRDRKFKIRFCTSCGVKLDDNGV